MNIMCPDCGKHWALWDKPCPNKKDPSKEGSYLVPQGKRVHADSIIPLDIYNLDGFANQTYRAENDVAMLEIQVAALANKLTEVIDLLNKDPEAKNG